MTKIKGKDLDDLASSVPLQMVICNEDCPSYDQNQRDGGARIALNDHLDDPASSVLLHSFANGLHCLLGLVVAGKHFIDRLNVRVMAIIYLLAKLS